MWPPALALAVLILAFAWYRGRVAAAEFALLVEAAVDTQQTAFAASLGIALPNGHITAAESARIMDILQKGG